MAAGISSKPTLGLFERSMAGPVPTTARVLAGALYWPAAANWRTPSSLRELGLFLAFLASLRVGAMIVRRAPVFNRDLQLEWYEQRQLAKHFDSYQWAKLLWIGLGMILYAAWRGRWEPLEGIVAALVTGAGAVGQTFWVRHKTESREDAATAR